MKTPNGVTKQQHLFRMLLLYEIQNSPSFEMSAWIHTPYYADKIKHVCGTAACIGGHAAVMFDELEGKSNIGKEDGADYWPATLRAEVQEKLGLDFSQAQKLFYPNTKRAFFQVENKKSKRFITKAHAVAVLKNWIKTNKIEWDKMKPKARA